VLTTLSEAAIDLSARRLGALIVIERETGLDDFIHSGVPVDAGLLLLCQLAVGEKLADNSVAQQLLLNPLDYADAYKLEHRPVVAALGGGDPQLAKALGEIGLRYTRAADPLEAVGKPWRTIAVVAAPDRVEARRRPGVASDEMQLAAMVQPDLEENCLWALESLRSWGVPARLRAWLGAALAWKRPALRLVALISLAAELGGLRASLVPREDIAAALEPYLGLPVRLRGVVVQPPSLGPAATQLLVDAQAIGSAGRDPPLLAPAKTESARGATRPSSSGSPTACRPGGGSSRPSTTSPS